MLRNYALLLITIILFSCQDEKIDKKNGAYEALQMLSHQRSYPQQNLKEANYFDELSKFQAVNEVSTREQFPDPWEGLGPHNIAGRALAIAINPLNNKTIYTGSASGGLWRSYDQGKGVSWEQVALGHPVLAVSSIAFAPNDSMTMYIGTGEVYNASQSGNGAAFRATRGTYGIGLLKSSDGGITWEKSIDWSYDLNRGVHAVKVAPSDPQTIYAGTTEGVFKSIDAGSTWTLVLDVIIANDLVVHPDNPDLVIVGCGNLGSSGRGIYRTIDGGENWDSTTPVPFNGKIQFAEDPTNSEVVYASIGNGFGFSDGATWLYKTENRGDSWDLKNTTDYSKWQGWFAHDVAVNPNDPNHLTMIGIEIYSSMNGGQTVNQITNGGVAFGTPPIGEPDGPPNFTHSDHHDIIYDQTDGNLAYVANDGGVYASEDGGLSWESRNGGMQTTQFYNGFSVFDSEEETLLIGGLQDNSTVEYTGSKAWNRVIGGDGSWTALHSSNSDIRYGSAQNLNMFRTDDGSFYFNLDVASNSSPTAFIAPFVVAPSEPNVVYAGRNRVIRSDNGGDTWSVQEFLSSDFLFSMDVSPSNSDYLYAATAPNVQRAKIFRTKNGGASYDQITGDLPDAYINDIHVNPNNPEKVYITMGGFGDSHVFMTENGGQDWVDISSNLPKIPTSAIVVDPFTDSILYVGNDFGVFYSEDEGASWESFNKGIIDAILVMDLKINSKSRKIYVATHGSGAFERDLIEAEQPSNTSDFDLTGLKLLSNPAKHFIQLSGANVPLKYRLFDVNGRILADGSLPVGLKIDLEGISSGNYFLNVSADKEKRTFKVVVVK